MTELDVTQPEDAQVETALSPIEAEEQLAAAVGVRHSIARRYVMWVRKMHPDATPAEIIKLMEGQYTRSVGAVGAAIAGANIAVGIGIVALSQIGKAAPGGAAAQAVAGAAVAAGAKANIKKAGLIAAKAAAPHLTRVIPAGDAQLQFEMTAIFALAVADVHSLTFDKEQSKALVYGLSNGRVAQETIASMAMDIVIQASDGSAQKADRKAPARADWSYWAKTLAEGLPEGKAKTLAHTIGAGKLDGLGKKLGDKQKLAIEYGVGAIVGGVTKFVFGRQVVEASRIAFPPAPDEFPEHLAHVEPSRALAALKSAARATGEWISDAAGVVGGGISIGASAAGAGVVTAAETVSRPFRRVDLNDDGVPDEPQALTVIKGAGAAVAGAAHNAGDGVARVFKGKKEEKPADGNERSGAGD